MNNNVNNIMIAFKNSNKNKDKESGIFDIISSPLYIRRFASLLQEIMQKGSDLMHLPNGNVIITETKVLTYQYIWNKEKGRFERAKLGAKSTKAKEAETDSCNFVKSQNSDHNFYYDDENRSYNEDDSEEEDIRINFDQKNDDIDELV